MDVEHELIRTYIVKYIESKSKTNKTLSKANIIKGVKKSLKIADDDTYMDGYIWTFAKGLSQDKAIKITEKSIVFRE